MSYETSPYEREDEARRQQQDEGLDPWGNPEPNYDDYLRELGGDELEPIE